jgi:N-acetylmuramoyl-L-alanine amidase
MSNVLFLDAGHGGIAPDGSYTTAPSKMWQHTQGAFHKGTTFYEGVKNRAYCSAIIDKVRDFCHIIPIAHEYLDTPLSNRTLAANTYHNAIAKGISWSEHSNATGTHNARGFLIYTSKGQTQSDVWSQYTLDTYSTDVAPLFGINVRQQKIDGDGDFEEDFHMVYRTNMPSILVENLFFDEYNDACLLMSKEYLEAYSTWAAKCIKWAFENIKQ